MEQSADLRVGRTYVGCLFWSKDGIFNYIYRNFLDRDALGGLAVAIRDWAGAVVIISHNEEFVGALCKQKLAASQFSLTNML